MTETADLTQPARSTGPQIPFGRRGLLIAALAVIAAGLALNWGWLTAVGAAPLILSLAPCAAMCALGLCMRGGSNSCETKSNPALQPDTQKD
ncbi:hypothetical protein [Acuticoccus sp. I52.16.1]|uniref:hypothetical protein n=1 Tax=Acuticoccus sp. I52.16.1 TaxID=2928472 RepID=UPI001FD29548|nr:hypothetical protein [Acuticoccus sp. I52.16.1]UOM37029.1 hypothetical protein MRB58_23350 [Acuticoccus sp. I52.16.1]